MDERKIRKSYISLRREKPKTLNQATRRAFKGSYLFNCRFNVRPFLRFGADRSFGARSQQQINFGRRPISPSQTTRRFFIRFVHATKQRSAVFRNAKESLPNDVLDFAARPKVSWTRCCARRVTRGFQLWRSSQEVS